MSLLTVVSDAMELCSLEAPSTVIGSTEDFVPLIRSLLRVEGDELSKYHGWRSLKVRTHVTGDGTTTLFSIPADFTRFSPGEVMWEQNGLWQTLKQASDEEMLALQSDTVSLLRPVWRLVGSSIEFYPAPSLGQQINFDYRTEDWVTDSTGVTRKTRPTVDSDLFLVPEQVLTLGLVWRFKQSKGLTYDEDFRTHQMTRERYVFNDQPRPIIRISRKLVNDGLAAGMYGDIRVVVP